MYKNIKIRTLDEAHYIIETGATVREVAKIAGGSGGGKPDMAMAGGKDISKIDDALMSAKEILGSMLK